MSLTKEQLMQPRYKVIAGYPEMEEDEIEVGQILQDDKERPLRTDTLDKYPHLFKKLAWWEDRTPDELPAYLKTPNGQVVKIVYGDDKKEFLNDFEPSDESEYQSYTATKH